jgi:hypothetical protein
MRGRLVISSYSAAALFFERLMKFISFKLAFKDFAVFHVVSSSIDTFYMIDIYQYTFGDIIKYI